jgi:hypothetical protein
MLAGMWSQLCIATVKPHPLTLSNFEGPGTSSSAEDSVKTRQMLIYRLSLNWQPWLLGRQQKSLHVRARNRMFSIKLVGLMANHETPHLTHLLIDLLEYFTCLDIEYPVSIRNNHP